MFPKRLLKSRDLRVVLVDRSNLQMMGVSQIWYSCVHLREKNLADASRLDGKLVHQLEKERANRLTSVQEVDGSEVGLNRFVQRFLQIKIVWC